MRAAVAAKPNAARAWTYLSHLLSGQGQTAESKLAAVRSYEADPYLSSAKQTLSSLFDASFDLEDQVEAEHWCQEGHRRFPDYFRFTECQLWLMGMKGQKPDIANAWKVNEEFVKLSPTESPRVQHALRQRAGRPRAWCGRGYPTVPEPSWCALAGTPVSTRPGISRTTRRW